MAKWLIHLSASVQGGVVYVRPEEIAAVVSTPDGGSMLYLQGGSEVGIRTTAAALMKVLSDPPSPPANVHASQPNPTVLTPTSAGTAEPGAAITIAEDNAILGTTTAEPDGSWTLTTVPLTLGDHAIVARQKDVIGNTSGNSPAVKLTIQAPAPPPPPVVTQAPPTPPPAGATGATGGATGSTGATGTTEPTPPEASAEKPTKTK